MNSRKPDGQNGELNPKSSGITELLGAFRLGDRLAESQLFTSVHRELKVIARRRLSGERVRHTLQPTDLVSEAYEKLLHQRDKTWQNRAHFLAIASRVMRQILIDYARRRNSEKRGGGDNQPREVAPSRATQGNDLDTVLAVHEALEDLAGFDERQAAVVEMMFFGGLTQEEVAEHLGLDVRTIKRDWSMARAWLAQRLRAGSASASAS